MLKTRSCNERIFCFFKQAVLLLKFLHKCHVGHMQYDIFTICCKDIWVFVSDNDHLTTMYRYSCQAMLTMCL